MGLQMYRRSVRRKGVAVNQQFHEDGELVAEITDSQYVVHKRGDKYEYELSRITHQWIASHVSGSDHNVFFAQNGDRHDTTVAVTFTDRRDAENLRNAVLDALPRR